MCQYTHGMPYGAFCVTVTVPPAWPSSDGDVALGLGETAAELDVAAELGERAAELGETAGEPGEVDAPMLAGTEVASGPRMSST